MPDLIKIYSTLLKKFGPQSWWPVTLEGEVTPKYHKKINKNQKHKLEIIFGAILTQNTAWKNVEKAITNLNKHNLIDVKKINKIEQKRLAELIKPSGYYNQKAKKLKDFCNFLIRNYNGDLNKFFKKGIDELRKDLLSINGIGPETADSIILYAAEKPIFVIGAYTKRIFGRLGFREKTYNELQELFMKNLPKDYKLFNEYHALLVELGKHYCRKKPLCADCALIKWCVLSKS